MPELGIPESEYIKEARHRGPDLTQEEKKRLAEAHNQEFCGAGAECTVIPLEGSDKKVVAFTYEDLNPHKAKAMFYLQRIFSTLFPHNFPKFYASFGEHPDPEVQNISGSIRQKIEGTKFGEPGYQEPSVHQSKRPTDRLIKILKIASGKEKRIKYPFEHVNETLAQLDVSLAYDSSDVNFMLGDDGGEYYVDTLKYSHSLLWRNGMEKIMNYMNEHNFSLSDKQKVKKKL